MVPSLHEFFRLDGETTLLCSKRSIGDVSQTLVAQAGWGEGQDLQNSREGGRTGVNMVGTSRP